MEGHFRQEVIKFSNDEELSFPERFRNEIYFVKDFYQDNYKVVDYESNFSVKYVYEGTEKYIVNGKRKYVHANQMLIVNDKSEVQNTDAHGTSFSIFIEPEIISDCYRNLTNSQSVVLDSPFMNANCIELFDEVISQRVATIDFLFQRMAGEPESIVPADFYYELATSIIRSSNQIHNRVNKLTQVRKSVRNEIYRRLDVAKQYLESTTTKKFDLNVLAQISCMSKFHLIRSFKAVFGITPHRYFIKLKMHEAKRMLENEEISVGEVALTFGYADIFTFSKQFKSYFGVSPSKISTGLQS